MLHIPEAEFAESMALPSGADSSTMHVISTAMASGRSRAFFFVSQDQRFLLKTASKAEHELMQRVLQPYTEHLGASPLSLLPRYVGLYTLSTRGKSTRFVVLANFFAGLHPISRRYDLKGSTHKRYASEAERRKGRFTVYKDLDFLAAGCRLHLDSRATAATEALRRDVGLLQRLRLIDYSLLVGVHTRYGEKLAAGSGSGSAGGGSGAGCAASGDGRSEGSGASASSDGGTAAAPPGKCASAGAAPSEPTRGVPRGHSGRMKAFAGGGGGGGDDDRKSARRSSTIDNLMGKSHKMRTSMAGPTSEETEEALTGAGKKGGKETKWMGLGGGEESMDVLAVHAGTQITYLGLVDILTQWTPKKRLEHLFNGKLKRNRDISCQPPDAYGARMLRFLENAITSEAPPDADPLLALEGAHPAAIQELAAEQERTLSAGKSTSTSTRTGGKGGKSKPPDEVRI